MCFHQQRGSGTGFSTSSQRWQVGGCCKSQTTCLLPKPSQKREQVWKSAPRRAGSSDFTAYTAGSQRGTDRVGAHVARHPQGHLSELLLHLRLPPLISSPPLQGKPPEGHPRTPSPPSTALIAKGKVGDLLPRIYSPLHLTVDAFPARFPISSPTGSCLLSSHLTHSPPPLFNTFGPSCKALAGSGFALGPSQGL